MSAAHVFDLCFDPIHVDSSVLFAGASALLVMILFDYQDENAASTAIYWSDEHMQCASSQAARSTPVSVKGGL
ncbi:hypothetical protein RRF57_012476 [Xylaria bambusicola]|uniref:Uncharacterized protein n=1 Tax=Xylaria bambusicola TaxID=326684 RepID=A0AAN7V488_9PEZI